MFCFKVYKMNEMVKKNYCQAINLYQKLHLKQPGFTYWACGPFTKNKERIEKLMQTGNTDFICKKQLYKACFQHDMA